MLHFTGMHLASALFFETAEQIFERVFKEVRPRAPAPTLVVKWCKFVNPNSMIQSKDGKILVRITDVLQEAPAPILESLAWILLSKLYRMPVPPNELLQY